MLHATCQQIWKTQQWPQDWKGQFSLNIKECSNYCTIALISHASMVMLQIPQARLQQYNWELPDVQAGFRKGRGTRDPTANITGSQKKQESSRKTSTSTSLTMPKPLTVWITRNCGKFFKRWEYQTTWPASWQICMKVKQQPLQPNMEQTGSKLGKECVKAAYCHPVYLTYMQSSVQVLSCVRLCDPMNCSMPGLLVHHQLLEFTQTHVHWVGDAIQPSHPLSAPSPPAFHLSQHQGLFKWVRWPKYWNFKFSISPSNEHPELISFRMDWLDLLAVQGTLKSLFQHTQEYAEYIMRNAELAESQAGITNWEKYW